MPRSLAVLVAAVALVLLAPAVASAAPITLSNVNTTGDAFYDDSFSPGAATPLHVAVDPLVGDLTSASLYVDGQFAQDVSGLADFDWGAPPGAAAHTLVVHATDAAGNDVTSNELTLYALVRTDARAVGFLWHTPEPVAHNPFSTDPIAFEQPPDDLNGWLAAHPDTNGIRMLHGGVLEAKSDGTQFVSPLRTTPVELLGKSHRCDDPPSQAAAQGRFVSLPQPIVGLDENGFKWVSSHWESRVDVPLPPDLYNPLLPDLINILVSEPLRGVLLDAIKAPSTGQTAFVPWIASTLQAGISPDGRTFARIVPESTSSFPLHYPYVDGRLATFPTDHPAIDYVSWVRSSLPNALLDAVHAIGVPTASAEEMADLFFKTLLAHCARERMLRVAPDVDAAVQASFAPPPPWADPWLGLVVAPELRPYWNEFEFRQGVAQPDRPFDPNCPMPGCPAVADFTMIGVMSPMDVHVYDGEGRHTGPLPDGTIEQGIPSVDYDRLGHETYVVVPRDPSYRMALDGTDTGVATVNVADFSGRDPLRYEQYSQLDVSPQSTGELRLGPTGPTLSYDADGDGTADVLEPTSSVAHPAPWSSDTTPPVTTATVEGVGDNGWYRSASVRLSATDDLSGVAYSEYSLDGGARGTASQATPGWSRYGGSIALSEGQNDLLYRSTDYAGNVEHARAQHVAVDATPPAIAIVSPQETTYVLHQPALASYSCTDALSGVASCLGTVASGSQVDTGSVGAKAFTVTASDRAGNTASKTISYVVTYRICPLYDEQKPHHAPSTVPVKLQLCDYWRANMSSSSIAVIARSVVNTATGATTPPEDAGNANPGGRFRFVGIGGGAYLYNLKTRGLSPGSYELRFTAAGDPVLHAVGLRVR